MYGIRNRVVSVRVDSDLYDKFRKTVDVAECGYWKKTNASDLIEEALRNYIEKHSKSAKAQ